MYQTKHGVKRFYPNSDELIDLALAKFFLAVIYHLMLLSQIYLESL